MPQGKKFAEAGNQKRQTSAIEKGHEQKDVGHPRVEARAWASVNKLPGEGKKIGSGRKVPSGPLGGSGRKTNLARSS